MQDGSASIVPNTGESLVERAAAAKETLADIYVLPESHRTIRDKCEILRLTHLRRRGRPMGGLRLAQLSSAGKTSCFEQYRDKVIADLRASTGIDNPYVVLLVGLESSTTPKELCQTVLEALGDQNHMIGTKKELIDRMRKFIVDCDVQLLVIDEVQHLKGKRNDRRDVTDMLKKLLQDGIVPIVFVGDETSPELFRMNEQLGNRCGTPLSLRPLPMTQEGNREFAKFCLKLQKQMLALNIISREGALSENNCIEKLRLYSRGHLGRVSRIVAEALEAAILRNAATVEAVDINYAIENFAMANNYLGTMKK